jgi:hypothetical protein
MLALSGTGKSLMIYKVPLIIVLLLALSGSPANTEVVTKRINKLPARLADTLAHWLKLRAGIGIAASLEIYMQRKTPLASNVANALTALEREPEITNPFAINAGYWRPPLG